MYMSFYPVCTDSWSQFLNCACLIFYAIEWMLWYMGFSFCPGFDKVTNGSQKCPELMQQSSPAGRSKDISLRHAMYLQVSYTMYYYV